MKGIYIEVLKYMSDNGEIYDKREEALLNDKFYAGIAKICPECKGTGEVDPWTNRIKEECPTCKGKCYVELKKVWK